MIPDLMTLTLFQGHRYVKSLNCKTVFFIHQMSWLVKNCNIGNYSDTIDVINVKLCMMVLLIELYLFISLSVALTIFKGHSNVAQFQLKILCSYPVKLKLCKIVK